MVEVRCAGRGDWRVVKRTRLRALADSPHAFGSTLARELDYPDEHWQRWAAQRNWFIAESLSRSVGIVAYLRTGEAAEIHLVGMWVEPADRGTGVGEALVDAVLDEAGSVGAAAVSLWVAVGNSRAKRFYERCGFCATGRRQPLASAPHLDEELLRRSLDRKEGPAELDGGS